MCEGTGEVWIPGNERNGYLGRFDTCRRCGGSARIRCDSCGGRGGSTCRCDLCKGRGSVDDSVGDKFIKDTKAKEAEQKRLRALEEEKRKLQAAEHAQDWALKQELKRLTESRSKLSSRQGSQSRIFLRKPYPKIAATLICILIIGVIFSAVRSSARASLDGIQTIKSSESSSDAAIRTPNTAEIDKSKLSSEIRELFAEKSRLEGKIELELQSDKNGGQGQKISRRELRLRIYEDQERLYKVEEALRKAHATK